ncbi:hypothetical protein BS78_06G126200 [Paspalum vaginatum]|nr:hypothetical protein BS78_06G126200 [Paspalum vaginatum]
MMQQPTSHLPSTCTHFTRSRLTLRGGRAGGYEDVLGKKDHVPLSLSSSSG